MSVVVGVLTIDLKAETSSFTTSMGKAAELSAKTANDIKRSLEKIALAGVAMAGALATGTVAMIKGALDSADAMGKMAAAAGTTVESLTTLNYAAKLSNVETETLAKGLEKLSQSAFKAQNGNVGLERIFGKLGVSVTDSNGKIKDSGVLMEQIAVKFANMGTSGGKTALAMQLFGRSGAALIPMLNQYGAEQEKVNAEAHQFGLVLSTSTVEVAMKAHDNLDRLQLALKGIGFSVLSATLPALDDLLEKLINIAKNADMQGLAKAFGEKVTGAVHLLGDALDFATQHAHALKIALEALAGLKIAAIAIPIVGDLAGGGIEKVGAGLSKLVISGLGLAKVIPVLAEFAAWIKYTAEFAALLASEEGIAAAAGYVFGGALAAIGGPITLAIAGVVGLSAALYKFRDATFSLGDSTYKLRDVWNANWIAMGWELSWIKDHFNTMVSDLKAIWSGFTGWLSQNSIAKFILGDLQGANDRLDGYVGKFVNTLIERLKGANERLNVYLTPKFVVKALDQAKAERELSRFLNLSKIDITPATASKKKDGSGAPDTSGLGKQTENPVDKVLANLQEKLNESKQTLAAAGLEEEAQRKVAAANKASNEIMKLGEEIAKQTGARTKDFASLVDQSTQALIREKNAQISDNEAKTVLLNLLGTTSRASALSIAQSGLMVEAMNKGSDAVLRETAITQAWNELRAKGGSAVQILARSQEIYAESIARESQAITGNIINLKQELEARRLVTDATLGSVEAQDDAALKAKLYALDVQIAGSAAGELRDKLIQLRDATVAVNAEEVRRSNLENARSLQSPAKQADLEREKLEMAVSALRDIQGGTLSYAQSLQIAAKNQEIFDQQVDSTVKLLLKQGNAADGMKAFFLDMQKQAVTAGQIIYEALHSAFEKLSDNLTELISGGKADFGKMFQDIGKQMLNSSIKSGLQQGLGALGKILPPSIGGPLGDALKGKADGSSAANALWVRMASADGSELTNFGQKTFGDIGKALGVGKGALGTGVTSLDGITGIGPDANDSDSSDASGSKSTLGSIFGVLGGLFGKSKAGSGGDGGGIWGQLIQSVVGAFIPHAEGGAVSPGNAYLVGERGPEILTGASGNITSNVNSRRMLGNSAGNTLYYNIDARGTDPVLTEQRTRAALIAVHSSAISTSVQVNADRVKRMPQRIGG